MGGGNVTLGDINVAFQDEDGEPAQASHVAKMDPDGDWLWIASGVFEDNESDSLWDNGGWFTDLAVGEDGHVYVLGTLSRAT